MARKSKQHGQSSKNTELTSQQLRDEPLFVRLALVVAQIERVCRQAYSTHDCEETQLTPASEWWDFTINRMAKEVDAISLADVLSERDQWILRWRELHYTLTEESKIASSSFRDPVCLQIGLLIRRFAHKLRKQLPKHHHLLITRWHLDPSTVKHLRDYNRAVSLLNFAQFHLQNAIAVMRPPSGNRYSGEMYTKRILGNTINLAGKPFSTQEIWRALVENSIQQSQGYPTVTTQPIAYGALLRIRFRLSYLKQLLKQELNVDKLPRFKNQLQRRQSLSDKQWREINLCFSLYSDYQLKQFSAALTEEDKRVVIMRDGVDWLIGILNSVLTAEEQAEAQWYRSGIEQQFLFENLLLPPVS